MFKKKNKEVNVSGKRKGAAMKLLGSLLVALALFGVLIGVEKNIMSSYEKETVVLCKTEVPKGTKITKENASQYFYLYEVDVALAKEDCIRTEESLYGTVAARTISPQEIVRKGFCIEEASIYAGYKNPIECSVTADNPGDIVSGTIRRGDRVDIAVVNKDTLAYELIMKNVYVLDAFTTTGEKLGDTNEGTAATMLTIVEDKGNYAKFCSAREIGNVVVTKLETEK